MAGNFNPTPTFGLQPSATRIALSTNYITDFNFLSQYLPDTYEKEFERYGNRSVASFMRMVGAEMPCESDLIKWAEQGRLHVKYTNVSIGAAAGAGATTAVLTISDDLTKQVGQPFAGYSDDTFTSKNISSTAGALGTALIAIRKGQTVLVSHNNGDGINKAVVTAVNTVTATIDIAYYEAGGQVVAGTGVAGQVTIFVYGSEFAKGTVGMEGSLEGDDLIFENKPIILKDK